MILELRHPRDLNPRGVQMAIQTSVDKPRMISTKRKKIPLPKRPIIAIIGSAFWSTNGTVHLAREVKVSISQARDRRLGCNGWFVFRSIENPNVSICGLYTEPANPAFGKLYWNRLFARTRNTNKKQGRKNYYWH
jgi:hypothetical protein